MHVSWKGEGRRTEGEEEMTSQVVRVKRHTLAACMTCPLCDKLLKEATSISECLHTFCRKCIYAKFTDEEQDCCPICNIDLGCSPMEKLRPDHNLQDIRAKVFPSKRRKVKTPESVPPISLPTRRKERSLSSLVVSTPRVSTQNSLTGKRTKAVARKASSLRRSSFSIDGSGRKEEDAVNEFPESSSSRETRTKIAQYRRQHPSSGNQYNHLKSNKDTDNAGEPKAEKADLWKPLNCLVEAANRTKSFKQKAGPSQPLENDVPVRKAKGKEHVDKRVYGDKNGASAPESVKPKKLQRIRRKRAATSEDVGTSAQTILDAAGFKHNRSHPIWFTLLASDDQEEDARLPQISCSYLRIKDGNLPVSFIQKYLMNKLDLSSEAEVEIACQGQAVLPSLQLYDLVDLWLQTPSLSQRVQASVGSSAKDFMMVLTYRRKVPPTEVEPMDTKGRQAKRNKDQNINLNEMPTTSAIPTISAMASYVALPTKMSTQQYNVMDQKINLNEMPTTSIMPITFAVPSYAALPTNMSTQQDNVMEIGSSHVGPQNFTPLCSQSSSHLDLTSSLMSPRPTPRLTKAQILQFRATTPLSDPLPPTTRETSSMSPAHAVSSPRPPARLTKSMILQRRGINPTLISSPPSTTHFRALTPTQVTIPAMMSYVFRGANQTSTNESTPINAPSVTHLKPPRYEPNH